MDTVLLLEDNDTSRFVIHTVLEDKGYRVIDATNAEEALAVCREHGSEIAILVADAILRDTNGPAVARRMSALLPGVPILFISGYPREQLIHRGLLEPGDFPDRRTAFLQKPFLPRVLLNQIHQLTEP